ncbi:hypothetical protein LMG28727_06526 [Paraburkholderia kirstenboschensis]|nr:hypothetical protein LMG28727_06526 [Paraburkholderia kirstenboschensis]
MLSRLYGSEQGVPAKPLVGIAKSADGSNPVEWLTAGDRDALSDMYAYAQGQGADLEYVDMVAFQLGYYRQTTGVSTVNWNASGAGSYDADGHRPAYVFNAQDTVSANAILNGRGVTSAKLDKGFLNYILDPGYGQNHIANFQFLEKFVNRGSNAGSTQSLGAEFSTFRVKQEVGTVKSKEVTESKIANYTYDVSVNPPVYTLTEHGRRSGWTIGADGYPVQRNDQTGATSGKAATQSSLRLRPPESLGLMRLALLKNVATSHRKHDKTA